MTSRSITVLKVGGSAAESDTAARLMQALAARRPRDLLIVPGGGDFADTVRAAHARHRLSDAAAHHMALLAMHIAAVMLADFAPGFVVADGKAQFEAVWKDELTPIWLPAPMVLAAADIPASWDVTSDSLAAWIAHEVHAARLILMKSCRLPAAERDARRLAASGVVDAGFAGFVDGRSFSWQLMSGVEAVLDVLD